MLATVAATRTARLAKERNPSLTTALVFGTPAIEDITLSDKQRDRPRSNVLDIQQEAAHRRVDFREVHTVSEAASTIVEMA